MVWAANPTGTMGENPIPVGSGSLRNRCGAGQTINRSGSPGGQHYAVDEIHAELLRLGVLSLEDDSSLGLVSTLPASHQIRPLERTVYLERNCRPGSEHLAH